MRGRPPAAGSCARWAGARSRGFPFFEGPVVAADLFDEETAASLDGSLCFFADDMAGGCFAFRGDGERVFLVDDADPGEVAPIADTFEAFLERWCDPDAG